MDCPRCASANDKGDRFCWLCGWDFTNGSEICGHCGLEIEEGSTCESCTSDPTAGWGNWNPPDEDDDE